MKIEIDLRKLKQCDLSADQFILLYLLYNKKQNTIKKFYTRNEAMSIRNSLTETIYLLNKDINSIFSDTIISTANVAKLLGIRSDSIDFLEFYSCYPMKVGSRILRAADSNSVLGSKHKKKYLDDLLHQVRTVEHVTAREQVEVALTDEYRRRREEARLCGGHFDAPLTEPLDVFTKEVRAVRVIVHFALQPLDLFVVPAGSE